VTWRPESASFKTNSHTPGLSRRPRPIIQIRAGASRMCLPNFIHLSAEPSRSVPFGVGAAGATFWPADRACYAIINRSQHPSRCATTATALSAAGRSLSTCARCKIALVSAMRALGRRRGMPHHISEHATADEQYPDSSGFSFCRRADRRGVWPRARSSDRFYLHGMQSSCIGRGNGRSVQCNENTRCVPVTAEPPLMPPRLCASPI
jgi:hypothetical protein